MMIGFGFLFMLLILAAPVVLIATLAGGIAGIPLGWLWYHWRGDVF